MHIRRLKSFRCFSVLRAGRAPLHPGKQIFVHCAQNKLLSYRHIHIDDVSCNKEQYRVVLEAKKTSPSSGESCLVVKHVFINLLSSAILLVTCSLRESLTMGKSSKSLSLLCSAINCFEIPEFEKHQDICGKKVSNLKKIMEFNQKTGM